ncbi:MAG: fructose-6-phosphate aldolase [Turicibacter sp.]|nr:fructose-6-phosphate aldolase [Turicibacter sp.]
MEFMLDTANLDEIRKYRTIIPLAGVTSNPSILKREGAVDFYAHMRAIRAIIGSEASLHVQVVAADFEGIVADARAILANIGEDVYVKVPVSEQGLKAMKVLKADGVNLTATAIYTKFQAYLAIAAGADYIAPYFNRMENQNIDPRAAITEMAREIARVGSGTKILAASFKNVGQVNAALECGAQAATMGVDILDAALSMSVIGAAVADFTADWEAVHGAGVTVSDL